DTATCSDLHQLARCRMTKVANNSVSRLFIKESIMFYNDATSVLYDQINKVCKCCRFSRQIHRPSGRPNVENYRGRRNRPVIYLLLPTFRCPRSNATLPWP